MKSFFRGSSISVGESFCFFAKNAFVTDERRTTMPATQEEQNKALITRLVEETDKGNLAIADELFFDDYLDHTPSPVRGLKPGKAGIKNAYEIFYKAFPDTKHKIHHLIAEGDYVVAHFSAKGTHTGELFGAAPTHKVATLNGIAIYKIVDGKISERWAYSHEPGVLAQLGIALPSSDR
jgi:predicted ester cyclase